MKKSEAVPPKRATEEGADGEAEDDSAAKAAETKPGGADSAKKAAEAKTDEAKKAEDAKQEAAAPPSGFRIQLAAVSSAEDANRQWQRILSNNKDLLGSLHLMVEKVEIPKKNQTLYRLQAGPFKSEAEAKDVCAKLAARKVSCFFVKA
jgi:cell division septation protein DedD